VHWAIREFMHTAALDGDVDPDRVSFLRTLRLARRTVTEQAAFPSEALAKHSCVASRNCCSASTSAACAPTRGS
jgi:hypothetical protein